MTWHKITSQEDIDELMDVFHSFTGSVLTEMSYTSGAFVMPSLLMYPVNAKRRVRMIFQRQDKDVPAIEIVFDEMNRFNLSPASTNSTAVMDDVYFKKHDDLIYWANTGAFYIDRIDVFETSTHVTWLRAKKAQWRIIKDHWGDNQIYAAIK
ncbi:hypothetical protein HMPREF0872_03690 [Veillonella montpellierensis DNF00314]|uniref:Uncharacterized protein n=1 Tax=Veillonella montpellierensis DNF00314 TaxID=1401067 RepID=A0A096AL88_9FIRM|nr:hypothetical protein [Veillonella montpellierensis]KGF47808.1 hypothetical protein HMPREF0872_03690 [Veillonella montpellierensis DNF00314]